MGGASPVVWANAVNGYNIEVVSLVMLRLRKEMS